MSIDKRDSQRNVRLQWAVGLLAEQVKIRGYGSMLFYFECGNITRAKLEQSKKYPEGLDKPE